MRTTLSLADDAILIARELAQRERLSLGEAVSRLVREGSRAQHAQAAGTQALKSRYSVLPMRRQLVTSEHVRRLMDEEGI